MPTLKEIKGRIASVKSTLKITSAMKLVSSAKLRKAQKAIEAMRPYEQQLQDILALASAGSSSGAGALSSASLRDHRGPRESSISGVVSVRANAPERASAPDAAPRAIIAIASNSSLCGGFNAAAIARVRSLRRPGDVVYSIGRKMADAMRKDGFPSPEDYSALSEHPAYGPVAALVEQLSADYAAGRIGAVVLVYNHFVSTARQVPVVEVLMGASSEGREGLSSASLRDHRGPRESSISDVIIEPGRKELLELLEPKVLKLKLYAALLDSAAAEHAARTVAMQTATDNAENLLAELTLQYNKGRQQKITNEILDLAGGQQD